MTFETAMAQMRELARAENVACGLNAIPKPPELGAKPKQVSAPRRTRGDTVRAEERRQQVAAMSLKGTTLREIAAQLRVTAETVKMDRKVLRGRGVLI
jgi:DNA-binding NarL/FixJ family response regulator